MAMQKNAQRLDDGWMDRCAAHYCMQLSPDMKTAVRNSVHAPKMCDLSFSHGLYVQGAGHAQQRTANLSRQCNVPAVHVCMRLFVCFFFCLFSSLSIFVCLSMCVAVRFEFVRNMYVWVCLRIEVRNRLNLAARFFYCAGTYLSEDCNMGILDPTAEMRTRTTSQQPVQSQILYFEWRRRSWCMKPSNGLRSYSLLEGIGSIIVVTAVCHRGQ